jgi:post-segregation antitoxin (ccd killing protein)
MPRMQVYLPKELYKDLKRRGLPASELLQQAVRAEIRRLEQLAHTDKYLKDAIAAVGMPSKAERTKARNLTARIRQRTLRTLRKAG